jgi:hypothetical protein
MGSTQQRGAGGREGTIYGRWLIWGRCPAEAMAFKHRYNHIQRLAMPEDAGHRSDYENRNSRFWRMCHVEQ